MKLINRLLLWQKFVVLGAIALVLAGIPFYLYFTEAQKAIDFRRDEQRGIEPLKSVLSLYKSVQDHRGLSVQFLSGNSGAAEGRVRRQAEADSQIAALDAISMRDRWDGELAAQWQQIKGDWKRTADAVGTRSVDAAASRESHNNIIRTVIRVRESVADFYKLSLDPDGDTFYLMKAVVYDATLLTEPLGVIRGQGADVLARVSRSDDIKARQVTDLERLGLTVQLTRAREGLGSVAESISKSQSFRPELKAKLQASLDALSARVGASLKLSEDAILNASTVNLDADAYRKTYSDTLEETDKFVGQTVGTLDELLLSAVSSGKRTQLEVAAIILVLAALGAALGMFIVRSVLRPVGHLVGVIAEVSAGNADARSRIATPDEIGQLARQFDAMMDERERAAALVKAENEQLNTSVLSLIQSVAQLSRKDLTIKVPVAEDVTGAVGDALNLLTTETAKVLAQVTDLAADVSSASLMVKRQSDTVTAVADNERQQVENTAVELGEAAVSMKRIADLAGDCNTAAETAIRTTQNALSTVTATVGGISGIRDTIRETEKRIKRLGERSQEISGVVGLINTIAERTHILALNASMHAASAGEAGRGFAVVADEVQRLAENARQATAQIATLVNNIQIETSDAVNTMNATISQVVEGSKLAEQAGEQMKLTQETTAELVASVQQIAVSSKAQERISTQLLERAGEIRKSTEQTTEQLREQAQQTDNLVEYARGLMGAVRVFKLPA